MEKQFSDCKWTIRSFIMYERHNMNFLFEHLDFYTNENAIDTIRENWDYLSKKHSKLLARLVLNTNAFEAEKLIEQHWDWFVKNNHVPWHQTNTNMTNLIINHWDWFISKELFGDTWCWCCKGILKGSLKLVQLKYDWFVKHKPPQWNHICRNENSTQLVETHWDEITDNNSKLYWYITTNNFELIDNAIAPVITQLSVPGNIEIFNEYVWYMSPQSILYITGKYWSYISPHYDNISWDAVGYTVTPFKALLIAQQWDWFIENNKLTWNTLCYKVDTFHIIERNWDWLFETKTLYKTGWNALCENPKAIYLIDRHWDWLMENNMIHFCTLFRIPTIEVMTLINKKWDSIYSHVSTLNIDNQICHWRTLCSNGHIIKLNSEYLDVLITKYNDKVCSWLCYNHYGIPLIEKHWPTMHKKYMKVDDYALLLGYSTIFIDEYTAVAKKWFRDRVAAELMARIWHPRNIHRFALWGIDPDM